MNKFKIITLGCKVNSYESQAMKEMLVKEGYYESSDPDLVIVNTCAVTSMAEHKSRQKVSSLIKKYPNSLMVVCGCSSQLHVDSFKNIEGVNIILGNNNHQDLISSINEYKLKQELIIRNDKDVRHRKYQNLSITNFDEKVRSFVKIGDGCDNFCSYCIIPFSRGNLRSRNKDEIINEIKELITNGYKEIVLTGIDIGSYGKEFPNYKFMDLLKDILTIPNLQRLKISSIEISQIDDEFINLIKDNKIITPHLHIPLQSGSDTVLKRMRRKYTTEEFYEKILKIRNSLSNVCLACDVIVGFPQETEEEFIQTCEFIKKCNFSFLHVFPYSPREGTLASKLPGQIDSKTKKDRVKRLISIGNELTNKFQDDNFGEEIHVLIENYDPKTKLYHGLSENYLDVYIQSDCDIINKIITVKYDKNKIYRV